MEVIIYDAIVTRLCCVDSEEIFAQKRALRAEIRRARHHVSAVEKPILTEYLTGQLQDLADRLNPKSLSCYLASPTEPETRPFLTWARSFNIDILLPISRDDGLLDWALYDGESESIGLFGLPEVDGQIVEPLALNDVDLILVPAAAVDRKGNRLGWGRGYYDRTLGSMQNRPPVYAIVFDNEVFDDIPHTEFDQRIDGVVTPAGIQEF